MANQTLNLTDELYQYVLAHNREDDLLKSLREVTQSQTSMPQMQISPEQGQLMGLLVQLMQAKKALEIGTFTGYSALSIARALPEDGRLICCDVSEEWTTIAKEFWQKAGVDHKINLCIAPAEETLRELIAGQEVGSFDFIFIDADKSAYLLYYELALTLLKRGGLMMLDNTLFKGEVVNSGNESKRVQVLRALNEKLWNDERITLSFLPLSDGVTFALKRH